MGKHPGSRTSSKGKRPKATDNPDNPDRKDKRPKATADNPDRMDNPDHKGKRPKATVASPDKHLDSRTSSKDPAGNTSSRHSKATDSRKASISNRAATHPRPAMDRRSRARRAKPSTLVSTFAASASASSS